MSYAISCAAGFALVLACTARAEQGAPAPSLQMRSKAQEATAAEAERTAQLGECSASLPARIERHRKLMAARKYWPATLELRACSELLDDLALKALVTEGEVKSYVQDIESPRVGAFDRVRSFEALARVNPQEAKRYEKLRATLVATLEQQYRDYQRRNRASLRAADRKWVKMITFPSRAVQDWTVEKALLEARADIRTGKPKLYISGAFAPHSPGIRPDQYEKLQSLPYADGGIGCVIDDRQLREAQLAYAVAYNDYVAEHYERK